MPRTGTLVGISGSVKNCGHVTSFLRDESFTWRRHAGISTRPLLEVSCSWCASALSPSEARVTSPPCGRTTACPPSARPRRPPPRGCVKVCVRAALCAHEHARAHRHARERVRACCRAHAWRRARACCRVHVRSFLFGIFSLVCSLVSLGTLGVAPMRHGSGRCREGMHPPATFVPGQAGGVAGPGSLVTTSEDVGPPPQTVPTVAGYGEGARPPEHSPQTWAASSLRGDAGTQDHLCQQTGSRGLALIVPLALGKAARPRPQLPGL